MIEQADIDGVLILSPDQYHGEYAACALKAGKHVFVEKPVTLCSDELKELIELKKEVSGINCYGWIYAALRGTFF
uniref:Gfo/Idh/MocA family oxidoreductase n=1 Tax=Clostridium sp. NkU-1 TaxID=1095009 RepID=UPI0006CF7D93